MNRLMIVLFVSALALSLGLHGCSDNSKLAEPAQEQLILKVVLDQDTIRTLTGNVTHIYGHAEMTSDKRSYGISGFDLRISLRQPWLSMNLLNERLRNVTDEDGRVNFFVGDQLRRESHYSTIQADWGALTASDSVWVEIVTN